MFNPYRSILTYLNTKRKLCLITVLVVVEIILFAVLNTDGNSEYFRHADEARGTYGSKLAFILFGNLLAMLQMIAFGTLPFGIGTIFITYSVATELIGTGKLVLSQIGARNMILCILPHGIFELAAIFMSILLSALWSQTVTCAVWRMMRRRKVISPFLTDVGIILKTIVFIVVPLITFSALIESTVSAYIAELVIK